MTVIYKRLSSQAVFTHSRLTVVEDWIELPNGETGDYLWFAGGRGGVTIIARDGAGKILVEQEYSYLPGAALYQFPGGGIEDGETPEAAANRELAEEVNYQAGRLTRLGSFLLDHRRSRAEMHVFAGDDLTPCESATKDEYEVDLRSFWLSEADVDALIANGKVVNAVLLAAWMFYKSHQPELP